MSKKAFFIILILSVVVTYGMAIVDALLGNSIIAGQSGFPFKFSSSSLFGGSSMNYPMLLLDIIFWFVVIWGIWKILSKISKK